MKVNLISDTVTLPSEGMRKAMANAPLGDDVFKQDPSVNELEEYLAQLFGMDWALFFPSGTMANQTAIKLHTRPGDQVICDELSHIYWYEGGGVSFNSGVSCRLVKGDRGRIRADQVAAAHNPPDFYHSPRTALVSLENTTNKGGGACYDLSEIDRIRAVCAELGLGLHMDGARIWNAMVATGTVPGDYGPKLDTLSVCLSKGLGCPVGSVLLGREPVSYEEAMRIRKILGGGMRQSGLLAAAGLFALKNQIDRLAEDHRRAAELAWALSKHPGVEEVAPVETNILIFRLRSGKPEEDFMESASQKEIQFIDMGSGLKRLVTHMDYTETMHQYVLDFLNSGRFGS